MPTMPVKVTSTIPDVTGPKPPLLIRGGYLLTMDPGTGDIPGGDVLVSDGAIAAVAPASARPPGPPCWTRAG